ncbi:chemotaxis protein CheR [Vibrio cholerae]|uniref:Chemotaxis protein methyltransferase n=1 Tax=Vibrio cholerae TaxID=666 RepID=A0A395UCB5_VIBCL|nr:protein-glutamate O-methyltransferase CheR [Vibrio cholerae]EGQ8138575.1 protein-glutamate O-methyltransferase CheR [Vibrio cholerae]EGQ9898342.1 protein-glutamate O-methyltransferase CheR [Vibrio cholerae]EGR0073864.1 protein-glutamate O-methyltransferase CheR [Vibrio cholerae]EGR0565889.1 protein-glutamate O-methyltransferase CheR [Vibrio cholerae]EIA4706924.1 protein-glutamate O-methyltransferase CheR [Vibrio cholerae]
MLAVNEQEFELTDKDFKFIQWFMHKTVGIYLPDSKRTMVYGRLSRQMRRKGLRRFAQFRELIESDEQERIHFINTLTTNKTEFFRESHHFEFIEKVLVSEWSKERVGQLRFWSAGCSTGEEPYTLVSVLDHAGVMNFCPDIKIWATDLDTAVLEKASLGIYPIESQSSIPERYLRRCFVRGVKDQQGNMKIKQSLQRYIDFHQLNLIQEWPFKQKLDLILCRNVMIYFDRPTQEQLIERFHQQLKPGGVLMLGHSESVGRCSSLFHHLGHTVYVRQ